MHHVLRVQSRRTLNELVDFYNGLALPFRKRADRPQILFEGDFVRVKGLLDNAHSVVEGVHFALELNESLRQGVLGLAVLIDVELVDRGS